MRLTSLPLSLSLFVVAPFLMAPGDPACPQCGGDLRDEASIRLLLNKRTEWQEFNVAAGERGFVELAVLDGSADIELVPLGTKAKLNDSKCYRDASYTRCEFTPNYDGLVGVAIAPRGDKADTILDYGKVD